MVQCLTDYSEKSLFFEKSIELNVMSVVVVVYKCAGVYFSVEFSLFEMIVELYLHTYTTASDN